ncbi:MAG: Gfo/Idh/MocA family oxidoreductase [Saprospiraceae bacterium]|nr:Gfo/Idh/MocA family oxidoreductase [Saprospiraceae bacterium]
MHFDRRSFIRSTSLGLGSLALPKDIFSITGQTEKKLGIALVGLGSYSAGRLAPALQETEYIKLTGIVTGTPEKAKDWAEKYHIKTENIYTYENYDSIKDNPEIDVVYIVLPNGMHAEYTIRGAQAGKHVICEKPMANSVRECEEMIAACKKAGVKLQIGYRLLYEPNNMEMERICREKEYGDIRAVESSNAFYARDDWDNWRFHHELAGGGPLMDMGVYSIHGVRHAMGSEPVAITAQSFNTRKEKFTDIEETLYWQMYFDSGVVANCMTSYSARAGHLQVHTDQASYRLEPAFGYGPLKLMVKGEEVKIPHTNHQAVQMDAFARNILDNTEVVASGTEGLNDLKVIEAIYKAAKSGEKVMV